MKTFRAWLAETTHQKNQLATLIQQGVGGGDRAAWQAILKMVQNKDDTQLQSIRQLVGGYVKHEGKAGAAARYLLDTIDEIENKSNEDHYGEKAREAINRVQETLMKVQVPQDLADELLDALEGEASSFTFMMQKQMVGGKLMQKVLPVLIKIGEHLLARHDEEEARKAMIEILGDMTYFSEHVPTVEMVFSRARRGDL